jgi:hypothetical protein
VTQRRRKRSSQAWARDGGGLRSARGGGACGKSARFSDTSELEVVAVWESGLNERGKRLNKFEVRALGDRWVELFGRLPPNFNLRPGTGERLLDPTTPQPPSPDDKDVLGWKTGRATNCTHGRLAVADNLPIELGEEIAATEKTAPRTTRAGEAHSGEEEPVVAGKSFWMASEHDRDQTWTVRLHASGPPTPTRLDATGRQLERGAVSGPMVTRGTDGRGINSSRLFYLRMLSKLLRC